MAALFLFGFGNYRKRFGFGPFCVRWFTQGQVLISYNRLAILTIGFSF